MWERNPLLDFKCGLIGGAIRESAICPGLTVIFKVLYLQSNLPQGISGSISAAI